MPTQTGFWDDIIRIIIGGGCGVAAFVIDLAREGMVSDLFTGLMYAASGVILWKALRGS